MQNKPVQYLFTDLWGLSMASIWQTISIIVGIIFIDLSDVITFHIGAIFMFCGAYYISNFPFGAAINTSKKWELRKDFEA